MWKPAQKIRFTPSHGKLPTTTALQSAGLFQPLKYRNLQLRDRTWVPAMVPWRATNEGEMTADVLDWYGRFARGRPAAIVVEATGIRDVPSGPLLRIGHPRYIAGLRKLVQRVQQESDGHTRLFIQLIDFLAIRRRPLRERFFTQFLAVTKSHHQALGLNNATDDSVRELLLELPDSEIEKILSPREWRDYSMGAREQVDDLHLAHIAELPQLLPTLFSNAAQRAAEAGFDGIELHYAHAYTMASFLSATNARSDEYGGSLDNRARLALEVFHAVKAGVPSQFVVGARFLADEIISGGSTLKDSCFFAAAFAAAGMDFLSLSRGGRFEDAKRPKAGAAAYPYTGPSGYECMPQYISDEKGPFGRNFAATHAIRRAVRAAGHNTPIVAAGGIHNFELAEQVLQQEIGDIVAAARQSLADPDWFEKLRQGRAEHIRICEYTNYCEGLDQNHKQVTCKLWDRENLNEPGIGKSSDGRRRLTAPLSGSRAS